MSSKNQCTSRMRSQSQMINEKCDATHHLDKLNSFPALALELFSSMARTLDFLIEGLRVRVSPSASYQLFVYLLIRMTVSQFEREVNLIP